MKLCKKISPAKHEEATRPLEEIGGQLKSGRASLGIGRSSRTALLAPTSRRWAVRESGRAAPPKHRETWDGVNRERSSSEFETKMWEERRALRSRLDLWDRGDLVLPRVGSLHYLCGHCGHAGHSLLVRDQQRLKPRSEHNLLRSDHDLLRDQKMLRPKSLHSSFDLINPNSIAVPANVRRKKKRRR